jgi:hypothetical protein
MSGGPYAFVGGGNLNNAIGIGTSVLGGSNNTANYSYATIGGGAANMSGGPYAFVGGGYLNNAIGIGASVLGGGSNEASGLNATVGGGNNNRARGLYSVVSGGGGANATDSNSAMGDYSTVGGGRANSVAAIAGTVSGGSENIASAVISTVGGGYSNEAVAHGATVAGGDNNTASGNRSTVSGGLGNIANGDFAAVGGGYQNVASGVEATAGGGYGNQASGYLATIGGGYANQSSGYLATIGGGIYNGASGSYAVVPGGLANTASGDYSLAAGRRASANYAGSFVWGDSTDADFASTAPNQFLIRASGGVGIGTTSPSYPVDVRKDFGDFAVHIKNGYSWNAYGLWADVYNAIGNPNSRREAVVGTASLGATSNFGGDFTGYGGYTSYGVYGLGYGATINYGGYFNGDLAYTGALIGPSDARFKENIQEYSGALSRIMQLKPRTFAFKSGREFDRFRFSSGIHFGFVAQELEQVFPNLVVVAVQPQEKDAQQHPIGEPMEYKGVKTLEMIPILVGAIQEQQKLIELLQAKIDLLEKK